MSMQAFSRAVLVLCFAVLTSTGCKSSELQPEFASSTDQASYAKRHPGRLKAALAELDGRLGLAQTYTDEFKGYPDKLKDPAWDGVLQVVELADVEGRSPHYAESLEKNGKVAAFYQEEKSELHKKVGGAVQYHAKNEGCTADMYSPAAHAMDRAFEKRLEERTRDHSEAHSYIRLNESRLGKPNVETLETQADNIALASYVTHVGLVYTKNELGALIADADAIDRTLTERIEELKNPEETGEKPSPAVEKARQEEVEALEAAKTLLAEQLPVAKQQLETAEQRIMDARKRYDDALSQLKSSIEEKERAATKPEAAAAPQPRDRPKLAVRIAMNLEDS